LLVRRGDAPRELNRIAEEANAWGVYLNRDHTPYARQRDARATRGLQMTGVVTQTFDDLLLVSPQVMVDFDGLPPAAFADFSGSWLEHLDVDREPPPPASGTFLAGGGPSSVEGWADSLAPPAGDDGVQPGATPDSARGCLQDLLADLAIDREPAEDAWPGAPLWRALALGTISAREVARAVLARGAADPQSRAGAEAFILALCRREHAYHLLHARPDLLRAPGPEGEYVRHLLFRNRLT
jgi:deoxyribodipyrimidine photo-lyase